MATVTSLGFSISSRFDASGFTRARRAMRQLARENAIMTSRTANMTKMSTLFGPAAAAAFALAAKGSVMAATGFAAAAGGIGVFGLAMYNVFKSSKEMAMQMTRLKDAFRSFGTGSKDILIDVAKHGVTALIRAMKLVEPAVRPVSKVFLGIAKDIEGFTKSPQAKAFQQWFTYMAPRAVQATWNSLILLSTGMFTFLKRIGAFDGEKFLNWMLRVSNAFNRWANGSGPAKLSAWMKAWGPKLLLLAENIIKLAFAIGKSLNPVALILIGWLGKFSGWLAKIIEEHPMVGKALAAMYLGFKAMKIIMAVNAFFSAFIMMIGAFIGKENLSTGALLRNAAAWVVKRIQIASTWVQLKLIAMWEAITSTRLWTQTAALLRNTVAWIANKAQLIAHKVAAAGGWLLGIITNLGRQTAALLRNTVAWVANKAQVLASRAVGAAGWLLGVITNLGRQTAALLRNTAAWIANKVQVLASRAISIAGAIMSAVVALAAQSAALVKNAALWAAQKVALVASRATMIAIRAVTLAWAAAQWLLNAALAANPIGIIVLLIAALVVALVVAYKKSETFRNIVNSVWAAVKAGAMAMWNGLKFVFNGIKSLFDGSTHWSAIWSATWNAIRSIFFTTWNAIKAAFSTIRSWMVGGFNAVRSGAVAAWSATWNAIRSIFNAAWGAIRGTFSTIRGWVVGAFNAIRSGSVAVWTGMWNAIKAAFNAAWGAIRTTFNTIKGWISAAWTWVKNYLIAAWNQAWTRVRAIFSAAWGAIRTTFNTIKGWVATGWTWVKNYLVAAWNQAWTKIRQIFSAAWGAIRTTFNTIKGWVAAAWTWVKNYLIAAWNQGWAKVRQIFSAAWGAIRTTFNAIKAWVASGWTWVKNYLIAAWNQAWTKIRGIFNAAWSAIRGTFNTIKGWVAAAWTWVKNYLIAAWNQGWTKVRAIFNAAWSAIRATFNTIKGWVATGWTWVKNYLIAAWNQAWSKIRAIFNVAWGAIRGTLNTMKSWISTAWKWVKNYLIAAWNQAWTKVRQIFSAAWSAIRTTFNAIKSWVSKAWTWLKNYAIAAWTQMWNRVRAIFSNAWGAIRGTFTAMRHWLANTWTKIKGWGYSAWGQMWDRIRSIFNKAWGAIRNSLHVMANTMKGIWNGIVRAAGSIWEGIKKAVGRPINFVIGFVADRLLPFANKALKLVLGKKAPQISAGGLKGFKIPGVATGGIIGSGGIERGFAGGGVLPGYTPGRDIHIAQSPMGPIGLSGGEGILRPEVMRLPGMRDFLHTANAGARQGGISGAKAKMSRKFRQGPDPVLPREGLMFAKGGVVPGGMGTVANFDGGGVFDKIEGVAKGVVGAATGIVGWAKKSIEEKGFNVLIQKVLGKMYDGALKWMKEIGPMGLMVGGVMEKVVGTIVNYVVDKTMPQTGMGNWTVTGKGLQNALGFAKSQSGKPYQWGGGGNPSYDCSGFMASIERVMTGRGPGRLYTTHDFNGGSAPSGWKSGLNSPFMIGVTHAGVGHMAGNLAGHRVESSGSNGVQFDGKARGADHPMFGLHYGYQPATKMAKEGGGSAAGGGTGKGLASYAGTGGGGMAGGGGKAYFTHFWDAQTASGRPMSKTTLASSYIPLGSKIAVAKGGKGFTGTVDDLGPAKFVYQRHPGVAVIDLAEGCPISGDGFGTFKITSVGSGRTLYGKNLRGYANGGNIPSGQLAVVGERGPELMTGRGQAVHKNGTKVSVGDTHIHFHEKVYVKSEKEFRQMVVTAISEAKRKKQV